MCLSNLQEISCDVDVCDSRILGLRCRIQYYFSWLGVSGKKNTVDVIVSSIHKLLKLLTSEHDLPSYFW